MATGDFAWLKLQMAQLTGRATVAELDNDAALAGQCVNEAYLDCYMPPRPDARRPTWALQNFGIRLRAPITTTVGVTQGSRIITGYAFNTDQVGSTVQIGSSFYTYSGLSGTDETVLEPVQETTGSYSLTIWHNSYPLAANIAEVQDAPVVLGWGILSPMANRAEDYKWRQIVYQDFYPKPGVGAFFPNGAWPGGINYPTGNPIFYRIQNGQLVSGAAIKALFLVEPMPIAITTIQFQGWVLPTELSSDADLPVLPGDLITRVLLPLARERWATIYKKYTGGTEGIVRGADAARGVLDRMNSNGQRDRPVRMLLGNC